LTTPFLLKSGTQLADRQAGRKLKVGHKKWREGERGRRERGGERERERGRERLSTITNRLWASFPYKEAIAWIRAIFRGCGVCVSKHSSWPSLLLCDHQWGFIGSDRMTS